MKFVSAFVILAVAFVADASVLPLTTLTRSAWETPLALSASGYYGSPIVTKIVSAGGINSLSSTNVISHHLAEPVVYAAPAPIAYTAHAPAHYTIAAHEGQYLAANRGSVHSAPLPGHTTSVQSLNVDPAPGTW